MQTIEFAITGEQRLHCVGCETRVSYVLRQLPAVRDVRASAKTQHIRGAVDGQGATGPEQIRGKLNELGYEAQQIGDTA